MRNIFKKNFIIFLIAVMALGFSAFFAGCHSSLNEEEDKIQIEKPDETETPIDPSTQALGESVFKLVVKGAEGDLQIAYGDVSLNANVRASLDGLVLAYIETEVFGMPAKLGLQFENGNKNVLAEIADEKFYFDLSDTAEVAERITAVLEGRDPVVPDTENGETYPPVTIAGLDLESIFSLLDNFDGTSVLGLLTEVVGVKTDSGFEYSVPLMENIGISLFVDNENNLKNLAVTGLELGGVQATAELCNIRYPEEKIVPVSTEEYINIKTYLPVLENFCKDKVESVPQLIETVKNLNLSAISEILRGIKDGKTLSFNVALSSPLDAVAAVTLDFSSGLKAKLSLSALGMQAEVYYDNGKIYILAGNVKIKCGLQDIADLLGVFGISFDVPDLGGLGVNNLRETLAKISALVNGSKIEIEKITANGDEVIIALAGMEFTFNVKEISLGANFKEFGVFVTDISAGEKVIVPEENYSELSAVTPIVKNLYNAVKGGKLVLDGALEVNGTAIALENVKADVNALAFAGNVKIEGIPLSATYTENYLYADLAGIAQVKLDKASMEKVLGDVMGALGGLNTQINLDAGKLLVMVKELTADETGVKLVLDLSEFGFGTAEIALAANGENTDVGLNVAGVSAELTVGTYAGEIVAPQNYGDVSDFVRAVNVEKLISLVKEVLENKTLGAAVKLSMTGLNASGSVALDFGNGIKAGLKAVIGGNEVEVYYADGNIYLIKSGVALKATAEDIGALTALFGGEGTLPEMSGIKIDEVYAENGALKVKLGEILLEIDGESLTAKLTYGDIALSLANISAGEKVIVPEENYSELSAVTPIVKNLYNAVKGGKLLLDGALEVNGTAIALENVKADVNALAFAGNVKIEGIPLSATYTENYLYADLAGIAQVKLDKASMEKVLGDVMGALGGLNTQINLDAGKLLVMVKELTADETGVKLVLDLSEFGFGTAEIALAANGENTDVGLNVAGVSAELTVGTYAGEIVAPQNYGDVSDFVRAVNVEKLISLVKEVLENKTLGAAVKLSMTGLNASGSVALDFGNGIKAGLKAVIGGNEVEVYYADGNIYLIKSGVALKATAEDIGALTALFGGEGTLPEMSGIKIDEVYAENGALKVKLGEILLELDGESLTAKLTYGDITLSLANISAGKKVVVPEITWSNLSDALPLVKNLYNKISSMTFGLSGTLEGARKVTFTDVRVIDSGTNGIVQDFEDGKLSIAGRVTVDDGYIHNIDVVYTENRLYVSYNDTMKLTMGKNSLDNIVKLVKDNLDFILDGFIRSDAVSDLFNSKDYGKILSVLAALDIKKDEMNVTLDLSSLGSESLSISLALKEDETLALSLNAANLSMNASLCDVTEEIVAPADAANYIDVSNIEYLIEGFLVTATKESKTFVMRGSVDLAINLFGIDQTITVGLEANVRINSDNSVDAYVVWDNSHPQKILGTYVMTGTIHEQAIKFGKTLVTLKDDVLYLDRMDMKQKTFLGMTTGFENGDYEHKKIAAADCSGQTLTNVIFYIFGLQPSLLGDGNEEDGPAMQYEKIFKNYQSDSPFNHRLIVATSVLAGSDMLGDLTADILLDQNKNITNVTAELVIDFVVGNITPTVNATHFVEETYDFTDAFQAIQNNEYSDFVV